MAIASCVVTCHECKALAFMQTHPSLRPCRAPRACSLPHWERAGVKACVDASPYASQLPSHYPRTQVSEKARNAVVLLVPDISRGTGLPTPRTPLTSTSACWPGMNNEAI